MKPTGPFPAAEADADPQLPSQAFRTIISELLFVHLFALGVAMLSNPRDGMASPLLLRLGGIRFLSSYLQLVWMDLGYDYFHSYGNNEFVAAISSNHQAEIELKMPDGSTQTVLSPAAGLPSFRAQRYTNLWNSAGRFVGQSGVESFVPDMVVESLLRQYGAVSATIRIQRRVPITIEQAQRQSAPAEGSLTTAYTGVGTLKNGQFLYQKLEATGDTAPAVGAAATSPPAGAPAARRPPDGSMPGGGSSPPTNGRSQAPRPLFPVDR
jgi:hypothetical protein